MLKCVRHAVKPQGIELRSILRIYGGIPNNIRRFPAGSRQYEIDCRAGYVPSGGRTGRFLLR